MIRSSALAAVLILAAAGCSSRSAGNPFQAHAGADFAALPAEAYQKACRDLGRPLGAPLAGDTEKRAFGPIAVLTVGEQDTVLVASGPERTLTMARADAGGLRWRLEAALGPAWKPVAASLGQRGATPVVTVDLAGRGTEVQRLRYLLQPRGAVLARIEDGAGRLVASRLAVDHPRLVPAKGRIESTDPVEQLSALLTLAAPSAAAERAKPGVISHLEKLAASTDAWVAQAAAEVLTLPRE